MKSKYEEPGGPTAADVAEFLGKMAKIFNPMRIFLIDIDRLECTVFGNKKPYMFGCTINNWKVKAPVLHFKNLH